MTEDYTELFRSQAYDTEQEAKEKIAAVIELHVYEWGWDLDGDPRIEVENGKFIAVVPLRKKAKQNDTPSFHL